MPLTRKGEEIEHAMESEYGDKKGKQVFYASKNKGTIKGVEAKKSEMARKMHHVKNFENLRSKGNKTTDKFHNRSHD